MGIQQITPQAQVDRYLEEQIARREKAIINALNYVGVQCINEGRKGGTYKDRTGNLRNSIGYVLVVNGIIKEKSAPIPIGKDEDGLGARTMSMRQRELAARFPQGIVLIVVAGMNYASYVEALNYNVLTSAEQLAVRLVPELMRQLGFTT